MKRGVWRVFSYQSSKAVPSLKGETQHTFLRARNNLENEDKTRQDLSSVSHLSAYPLIHLLTHPLSIDYLSIFTLIHSTNIY